MSLPFKELSESGLDALIASERKRVVAPLTEWRTLSVALQDEGLLRRSTAESFAETYGYSSASNDAGYASQSFARPDRGESSRRRSGALTWGTRAFASVLLLGTGMLIGRGLTAGVQVAPWLSVNVVDSASSNATPGAPAELVTQEFRSSDDALQALNRAQNDYQQAAAYLSAQDDAGVPVSELPDLRERLAALDAVVTAAQNAMKESPGDPLLAQYYMSTLGARRATLQMLRQNLPEGARLAGY